MQPRRFSWKVLGLIFVSSFLFCQNSMAGKVVKAKGKKIYIKLNTEETESLKNGDYLYLLTPDGKKKAIVQIKKMKGKKVLAKLMKGKAQKGYETRLRKKKGKKKKEKQQEDIYQDATEVAKTEDYDPADKTRPDLMFGALVGYGMASQTVSQGSSGDSEQSGSSIAVKGILDYRLFGSIAAQARVGLEMFSVAGDGIDQTITPTPTTASNIGSDITYLTIDLLVRGNMMLGNSFGLYGNLGIGIFSPMSSESKSLDEASISTTSVVIGGGGIVLPLGSWEVYAGADYYYFPPSEDVTTSVISGKLGVLFAF